MLYFYTMERPGWLPLNVVVYQVLLLVAFAYALGRGGAPEKVGVIILAASTYLTVAVLGTPGSTFQSIELGVWVVDLVSAFAFLALALHADRFWPLWVAALQILVVAAHAVRLIDAGTVGYTYAFMVAVWSYPITALIIIGTMRHRQRLARFGIDHDWSIAKASAGASHWHTKHRQLPHSS